MIARSQTEEEHLDHLHKLFDRLKLYKLRLNPNKCTFGVQWTPTYEGPFLVKNIFSGGAMILTTMDGDDLPHPVNADIVKKYYA